MRLRGDEFAAACVALILVSGDARFWCGQHLFRLRQEQNYNLETIRLRTMYGSFKSGILCRQSGIDEITLIKVALYKSSITITITCFAVVIIDFRGSACRLKISVASVVAKVLLSPDIWLILSAFSLSNADILKNEMLAVNSIGT